MRGPRIRSAERALRVLELVAESEDVDVSLSDLAEHLAVPLSTAHHLVRTLTSRGYLRQEPHTRRYRLGEAALALASATLSKFGIVEVARPLMQRFAAESGEAVTLSVLDWPWALAVLRAEPGGGLPEGANGARRAPLYCTAAGKVLVAEHPERAVRDVLALGMEPRTPHTVVSPDVYLAQLAQVRADELAIDNEEWLAGVRCVAVPVRDYSGQIMGALSVAGSVARLDGAYLDDLIANLRRLAATMSRGLGYRGRATHDGSRQTEEKEGENGAEKG